MGSTKTAGVSPSDAPTEPDRWARTGVFAFWLLALASHVRFFSTHILPVGREESDRVSQLLSEGRVAWNDEQPLGAALRFGRELDPEFAPVQAALIGLVLLWAIAIPAAFWLLRELLHDERIAALATVVCFGNPEVVNLGRCFVEHGMPYFLGMVLLLAGPLLRRRLLWSAPLLAYLGMQICATNKVLLPVLGFVLLWDVYLLWSRERDDEAPWLWAIVAAGIHQLPVLWGAANTARRELGSVVARSGEIAVDETILGTLEDIWLPEERGYWLVLLFAAFVLAICLDRTTVRRRLPFLVGAGALAALCTAPILWLSLRNEYISLFSAPGVYPVLGALVGGLPPGWWRRSLVAALLVPAVLNLGAAWAPSPAVRALQGQGLSVQLVPSPVSLPTYRRGNSHTFRMHPVAGGLTVSMLLQLDPYYLARIRATEHTLWRLCPLDIEHGRREIHLEDRSLWLFSWKGRCFLGADVRPSESPQIVLDVPWAKDLRVPGVVRLPAALSDEEVAAISLLDPPS